MKLTLTVPSDSADHPINLKLEGHATIAGRDVVHAAVPAQDMMQAFEYRHLVPSQELAVAVIGRASGKAGSLRIVSDMPVKIPAGGIAKVRVASTLTSLGKRAHLQLSDAPDGIIIKQVSPSDEGMDILLESDAAKVTPGQKGNLIVGAYQSRPSTPSKKGAVKTNAPFATLPAIPFEIVQK